MRIIIPRASNYEFVRHASDHGLILSVRLEYHGRC
jgi:hypothetical protein